MQENILFFYKSSHGELHAGLPILIKILSEKEGLLAYFIYEDKIAFENIPSFYKQIIEDKFKVIHIDKKNFIPIMRRFINSKNYIMTCDLGHTNYTKILTYFWPSSRIIFFQHAYALVNGSNYALYSNAIKRTKIEDRFNGIHHEPIAIAHNHTEIDYREVQGFQSSNIVIAGNLGYQGSWTKKLNDSDKDRELDKFKSISKKFEKTIFIPVRGIDDRYLSEDNSTYLLNALNQIISKFPEYLFLIKTHPRQNNIKDYINLESKFPNCQMTGLNTIVVSEISDLVISYWSSSIIDALAVDTPVIEFHRHDFHHHQLIKADEGLVSLYHYMDLCPFYKDYKQLYDLLKNPILWGEIREKQQTVFNSIFLKQYPDFVDNLFNKLKNSPKRSDYVKEYIKVPIKYIYKKLYLKLS